MADRDTLLLLAAVDPEWLTDWLCRGPVADGLSAHAASVAGGVTPGFGASISACVRSLRAEGREALRAWAWIWSTIPRSGLREVGASLSRLDRSRSATSLTWETEELLRTALYMLPIDQREQARAEWTAALTARAGVIRG